MHTQLNEVTGCVHIEETNLDSSLQVGSQIIIHPPCTLSENLCDLILQFVLCSVFGVLRQ